MHKYDLKRQLFILAGVTVISVLSGSYIYAQRPKDVKLTIDDRRIDLYTEAKTVRDALLEAGFTDLDGAEATTDLDAALSDDLTLTVRTLKTVTFVDAGVERTVNTHETTVRGFLTANRIPIDEDDVISPSRSSLIAEGDTITLDRYTSTVTTKTEPVPFTTKVIESDELYDDEQHIRTAGKNGVRTIDTKTTTKNGQVVETKVIKDAVTTAPVEQIVVQGTKSRMVSSPMSYTLGEFMFQGVVYWGDYKFTYYSQSVLPGGGLRIPGRHVNDDGYVCDGDGYIVLAGSAEKGTIFETPFGAPGKIYDRGTYGNHLDVYIR